MERTKNSLRTTKARRADTIEPVRPSLIVPWLVSGPRTLMDAMCAGYCKRGDKCWFLHVDGSEEPSPPGSDAECIICYDKPVTYGLMGASETIIRASLISDNRPPDGCSHVLCVQVRITSVNSKSILVHPIPDLRLCHAVHSSMASSKQQNRRCGDYQYILSLLQGALLLRDPFKPVLPEGSPPTR